MKSIHLIVLLMLVGLLGGCVNVKQPFQKIDYYTLEYEPPAGDSSTPLPYVAVVERFQVAPPYDSTKIVFSDKQFTRGEYNYHKWYAHPGNLVTYFMARDLRHSGLFSALFVSTGRVSATHVIKGTVEEFYEAEARGGVEAVLVLNITLIKARQRDVTKSILFQKNYQAREPCAFRNPRALAESMSRAMARISAAIIEDVRDHLQSEM